HPQKATVLLLRLASIGPEGRCGDPPRGNPAPPPPSTLPRFPPLPAARRKNRSACELLDLILGFQFWPQVDKFVKYLKYQLDYTVINLDQRTSFLRFCKEMNFPYLKQL
ncbi:unnamed protein product, partial [Musa acuminata subsp. burmannicoides]